MVQTPCTGCDLAYADIAETITRHVARAFSLTVNHESCIHEKRYEFAAADFIHGTWDWMETTPSNKQRHSIFDRKLPTSWLDSWLGLG